MDASRWGTLTTVELSMLADRIRVPPGSRERHNNRWKDDFPHPSAVTHARAAEQAAGILNYQGRSRETGVEVGNISSFGTRLTVLPSTFTVTFGKAEWKNVDVKMGEHKVLNPAVIVMKGASGAGHNLYGEDGTVVGNISSFVSQLPVPPGKYTVDVEGQKVPLDLVEGQRMEINLK